MEKYLSYQAKEIDALATRNLNDVLQKIVKILEYIFEENRIFAYSSYVLTVEW